MRCRSTISFLVTLPLILLFLVLVAYPAGYAIVCWKCSTRA